MHEKNHLFLKLSWSKVRKNNVCGLIIRATLRHFCTQKHRHVCTAPRTVTYTQFSKEILWFICSELLHLNCAFALHYWANTFNISLNNTILRIFSWNFSSKSGELASGVSHFTIALLTDIIFNWFINNLIISFPFFTTMKNLKSVSSTQLFLLICF